MYRKEANISPVFYLLLFIFMMSLIFLSTFEKTKLSVIFVSAYSILGSVLLSFILITSSYFKGEKTGGIEFYKEALITMEEKLIEIDVLPDNEIEEMINNKLSEQEEEVN